MADVFTLLSLPQTSKAFTAIRSNIVDSLDDGSASPRRKIPRLDTDSDCGSASRSQGSARLGTSIKLQVKGNPPVEPSNYDRAYAFMRRCIAIALTKDGPDILPSYESIYTACRLVVMAANKGEGLYDMLKLELEQCMTRLNRTLEEFSGENMGWITEFGKVCRWFERQISLLQSLATYLDQVYVKSDPNVVCIRDLAFSLFKTRVFENPRVATRIKASVEDWITWERNYRLEHESREHIRELISHLITHKQYHLFEEEYLTLARDYYTKESAERAETMKNDPKGFFKHVQSRIEEECKRSEVLLPLGSWSIVREVTERALWDGRLAWLASATVGPYMDARDLDTLGAMYALFARVDGTKVLCDAFKVYVQNTVQTIVCDTARDEEMVRRLLEFKALADTACTTTFTDMKAGASRGQPSTSAPVVKQPNKEFSYALADAFNRSFKARRNKPAEMIAKHLDKAMRRGQGATSDVEFAAQMDAVLGLYRFTDDKDVFRTFYHRALAKRLLLGRSASDDFEKSMLKKLKEQYDPEFGMGEEMFKDLNLSRDFISKYHAKLDSHSAGRKLTVMVLQRSAWPFTVPKNAVDLPPSMQAELTAFEKYYKQERPQHVLDWDHALGTVTMKGRFKDGSKELSLSLYQAIVLLLFNDAYELRYPDILAQTRMEDGELRRTLQSLACGKKRVLKKIPHGKDVNDDDLFRFNDDFTDPRAKVHINSIQAKVTAEESQRTNQSIEGDRKHYLDAAIVRIMKARKEMSYEQLKTATIDAVKSHFVPTVDAIKKRVDALVESDYLERSKEDRTKFLYVA